MGCRSSRRPPRNARASSLLPSLPPLADAQPVRVMALLAPASEPRRWRRELRHAPPGRRAAVAVALGVRLGVGSSLILGRLLRSDPEPWVRTVAARELGLVGGKAALKVLLRTAPTAGQDELPTLVRALGRVGRGSAEAYGCLETALTSSSEQVREAALLAMGQSLHPCRHDAAVSHLADGSPAVRRAAVTLLDGAPAGSEALRRACLDPEPTVASLARAAAG